ncbi:ABC transporter permease [Lysinibacillus piscis]|uniref:ABC transporter permease n=1 Tax=Lysinibacillus piscis TaxID=2518931 RepID=A0ABQ5NKJ7_9BACI|nr:FtsX-like permease family protein [Lysinibacillus sp. KH24]GLC88884.1 ABC transporter permease [Lysinibacillus sp. KH24]
MFTMRTIAFKLFRAAWLNVLTSISIITIAICLIMTMSVYSWNAHRQMTKDIQALLGKMDIMVGYNPEQHKLLSHTHINDFQTIPDVINVSSVSLAHTIVEHEAHTTFYTVGVENDALVKSRYHFTTNLGLQDVVISENVARIFKKKVGDSLHIAMPQLDGPSQSFIIREVLPTIKGTDSPSMVLLANDVLKTWMPRNDAQTAGMFALLETQSNKATLVGMTLKQLDPTLRVDVMSDYAIFKKNLQALIIFIAVLAVFILLIASVLLLSTFQLLFYKMKEQLMVLRALGASTKQIKKLVQWQLSLINMIGVSLGTTLSLLITKSLLPQLIQWMKVPDAKTDLPVLFVLLIACGSFGLLQLVTQWQVRKSSKLLPLQIATDNEILSLQWTKWKTCITGGMAVVACLLFANAYHMGNGQGALMILFSTLFLCGTLLFIMPYLFSALLKFALTPIRTIAGKEAYLACQQLMPQVRRNMPIILSIIGLMVILTFGSSLLKTVQHNELTSIDSRYETTIKIDNELADPSILPAIIDEIEALPSVTYAYTKSNASYVALQFRNEWLHENFETIDIQKWIQLGKLPAIQGNYKDGIIVTKRFADKYQLVIGDTMTTGTFDETLQRQITTDTVQIIGIALDDYTHYMDIYVDWSSTLAVATKPTIQSIMVETNDTQQTMTELTFLEQRWPALKLTDKETILVQSSEMFFQRWSLFVGVFIILIVATCLGVLQTLLHVIYTKRQDYAIQRLLGLSPNGVIKLILTQVLSFVLYGLAIGSLLGLLLTKMLSLIDDEAHVYYDFLTLGLTSIVFVVATLVVFLWQGYWISRKKLTQEMTTAPL